MSVGVRFSNNSLARLIDGERMIPQLIAVFNMANYTYTDDSNDTAHPGYIQRRYNFPYPSEVFSRPHINFFTLPSAGYDVWSNGVTVLYASGQPVTHPIWFVFALDYVSLSSSTHGMRIWKPGGGSLMYDSGNYHLNLRNIIQVTHDMTSDPSKFTDYPIGGTNSFSGAQTYGAYTIPRESMFRSYGVRFNVYGDWSAASFCRVVGTTLQTRMMAYDRHRTEDDQAANYDQFSKSLGVAQSVMVLDANMYL